MKKSPRRKTHLKVALLVALAAFTCWALYGSVSGVSAQEAEKKKVSPMLDPTDPSSVIYLDTSGKLAGTGDATQPVSEAWKAGMAWHPKALSGEGLPKDRYGLIDWVKIVEDNIIAPKHSLDPDAQELPALDVVVVMPTKIESVNAVNFPHKTHTYWLSCEVCHPKLFLPAKGQNNMNMSGIVEGKWCGVCHGKVAFPLTDCNRCHSEPPLVQK
jgi:c(7)-type cytochrome triheme protein